MAHDRQESHAVVECAMDDGPIENRHGLTRYNRSGEVPLERRDGIVVPFDGLRTKAGAQRGQARNLRPSLGTRPPWLSGASLF